MEFELEIIRWLQSFRNDFLDYFFQFWTMFGEELFIIAILGFMYWCYDKKIGETIGITVFVSLVFNSVLKVIVSRPRPFLVDSTIENIRPKTSLGYSFPSGHTQGAATTFGSLGIWIKKRWLTITVSLIILLVAISRMYLGVHYLSDVIVGAIFGIGISFGFYFYFKKHEDHKKIYNIIFISSVVIFLFSYLYFLFTAESSLDLYTNVEGVSKMMGAIIGFIFGLKFEAKKTMFSNHKILKKNVIRFVGGVIVVMAIRLALKAVFSFIINPEDLVQDQYIQSSIALLFDFIRYFAMVFVGIGAYPILFKKFNI
ncbi:MAG: phosphatase PAP2 family protein [Firmicutes bacterium]|nr:phosphatase PAP2 family protein [Bacillota bacterium]